jgi:hypothetical protein
MVCKQWFVSGTVLLLFQASGTVEFESTHSGLIRPAAVQAQEQPSRPDSAVYPVRLADVVLPLPPLVLPELLLPPYNFPSFDSERLDQELQLYLQYLRTHGKPDILIIGSSRSLQGIDPAALEEALAQQGHSNLKVYNFGINGATAQVMNLLVQNILTPEQLPRLIIWGDGSRAFNDGRPDRTYSQILASAGYQRIRRGERPIPSRTTDWEIPTFVTTASKSLAESAAVAATTNPVTSDLTNQGFQVVTEQFDPSTYYRQFPYVAGRYDGDYQNFDLNGHQTAATRAVAEFSRRHGITLLVVNLPLTRDYLVDPVRRRYEVRFQRHMWQIAAEEQFMFRNLSQEPSLMPNHYFADPSHINQHGARAVAVHLAADPTIPWHIVRRSVATP